MDRIDLGNRLHPALYKFQVRYVLDTSVLRALHIVGTEVRIKTATLVSLASLARLPSRLINQWRLDHGNTDE